RADAVRALGAGARGYVLKAGPPEELFRAVRSAAAGGLGLAPEIVDGLVGQVVSPDPDLTTREIEVIRLLASGRSNRAIAEALFLSEATVKTHLVRIYRKLGADNRAAAVSEAVRRGLLELT
ncbi:response regulator transcription factor, partial [Amycolatopsis mediterranei]